MTEIESTEELPTGMLRFVRRIDATTPALRVMRILQQEWRVTDYAAGGVVHKQRMEWRDVPEVEE